ncbi:ABC transporter permease/substrate-binding protein [Streptococcus sciuri]|uniref:ABC transporter permease/substrate-binding protein n=1 Tax=Streptococcus sciuri TaxID=2973939 RepID=A0ABT2F6Y2_9STRE|nr:ABC transporter permease/substrate-binding protein [Streptococcus sciuri]MCS4488194.1 ABC transporter permease/substrate-binding protein [Streptococcus sciuri]
MTALISTFTERFNEWTISLLEHLQISLLSLLLAMLIAIPLGIILSHYKHLSKFILNITGIFQTIPSLALLGLFIPFMGIGTRPATVALILYALFPILQNTITANQHIDPNLIEAATAFGMTRWERLKKFELVLSLPIIISGVRTSAVITIGTATLASLVGAGGLGSFILLGIDRNSPSLILIGAISSALLALLFNLIIGILEKAKPKTILLSLLIMVVGLGMSYTPRWLPKEKQETLVIAGKLGVEPDILISMYKLLIEDKTNIHVVLKPNFGKTSFLYEALKSGDIDIYPEFTGTITSSLLKEPPQVSNDPNAVYQAAKMGILKQDKLTLLKPMAYQNTYAIAVQKNYAKEHGLHAISDLKKVENSAKAGFTLEFNDREDGNLGLQNRYNLDLTVSTMEPSLRYQAITTNAVQIIDAYSTDSELIKYNLTTLKDDKQLFPPYQGAPLMTEHTAKQYPQVVKALNTLAGKISEKDMQEMNYTVAVKGKSAITIAKNYLNKCHLL